MVATKKKLKKVTGTNLLETTILAIIIPTPKPKNLHPLTNKIIQIILMKLN